jgi:hypothetical protein
MYSRINGYRALLPPIGSLMPYGLAFGLCWISPMILNIVAICSSVQTPYLSFLIKLRSNYSKRVMIGTRAFAKIIVDDQR